MKARVALTATTLLLLAGCGGFMETEATKQGGAEGKSEYHVVCTGIFNSMANCLEAAEKQCPGGYNITAGGPAAEAAEEARLKGYKRYLEMPKANRDMTFTCK